MKTLSAHSHSSYDHAHYHHHQNLLIDLKDWIKQQEPIWEYNRFGIGAAGIFVQVSFAALMVAILGMADASPWIYGFGILLAFTTNSIAFAQSPMRLVLGLFIVSIVINISLTLIYGIPLLIN
jgi:hypothetical protein